MDMRQQALTHWLQTFFSTTSLDIHAMPGDASFRRYFRVKHGAKSYVAMDAPPAQENNCRQFIAIANALRAKGLHTPDIIARDLEQGFLLLSDLGSHVYLKTLNASNAEELYGRALDALAILQSCRTVEDWKVPLFTADLMYQELQLFKEWFLLRHLNLELSQQTEKMLAEFFDFLAKSAAEQPQVFMHRDYQSANLMALPDKQVGILDFQDAFIGPVTYDLVSLLRDCYIAWPDDLVKKRVLQYKQKLTDMSSVGDYEFLRWFDLMGLQRHLKAILTFSRKFHRDHNANYLQHIPRTLAYIAAVLPQYVECEAFNAFLNTTILPTFKKVSASCAQ